MRVFEAVLELENRYQSGPRIGEVFLTKTKVACNALNEAEARRMIDENFRHRMQLFYHYEVNDAGEAPVNAQSGFAVTPA